MHGCAPTPRIGGPRSKRRASGDTVLVSHTTGRACNTQQVYRGTEQLQACRPVHALRPGGLCCSSVGGAGARMARRYDNRVVELHTRPTLLICDDKRGAAARRGAALRGTAWAPPWVPGPQHSATMNGAAFDRVGVLASCTRDQWRPHNCCTQYLATYAAAAATAAVLATPPGTLYASPSGCSSKSIGTSSFVQPRCATITTPPYAVRGTPALASSMKPNACTARRDGGSHGVVVVVVGVGWGGGVRCGAVGAERGK